MKVPRYLLERMPIGPWTHWLWVPVGEAFADQDAANAEMVRRERLPGAPALRVRLDNGQRANG